MVAGIRGGIGAVGTAPEWLSWQSVSVGGFISRLSVVTFVEAWMACGRYKRGNCGSEWLSCQSISVCWDSIPTDCVPDKGVARIWFRGGPHPFRGGPDPLFFASDPKSQGSPLMYFWLPPDFGGGGAGPPPPPPPWLRPWYQMKPGQLDVELDRMLSEAMIGCFLSISNADAHFRYALLPKTETKEEGEAATKQQRRKVAMRKKTPQPQVRL